MTKIEERMIRTLFAMGGSFRALLEQDKATKSRLDDLAGAAPSNVPAIVDEIVDLYATEGDLSKNLRAEFQTFAEEELTFSCCALHHIKDTMGDRGVAIATRPNVSVQEWMALAQLPPDDCRELLETIGEESVPVEWFDYEVERRLRAQKLA